MAPRASRLVIALGLSLVGLLWARQRAHATVPSPQGRWREVTEDELG
jgi:hypothetical protein